MTLGASSSLVAYTEITGILEPELYTRNQIISYFWKEPRHRWAGMNLNIIWVDGQLKDLYEKADADEEVSWGVRNFVENTIAYTEKLLRFLILQDMHNIIFFKDAEKE